MSAGRKPEPAPDAVAQPGLIVSSHRNRVVLLDEQQSPIVCGLRHGKERAVAGDRVEWRRTGSADGTIEKVLPRDSLIYRPTPTGRGRPIAANVGQLLLVIAPTPAYLPQLIDHCLVVAAFFAVEAGLVFNKVDLLSQAERDQVRADLAVYLQLDLPFFWVSAKTGEAMDEFQQALQSQSSILVGQSGVGKSSLTQRMAPSEVIAVQDLSRRGAVGRHTTSATNLYSLPGGGWIMDSPGVREFALWHIPPQDIANGFPEFRPYLGQCRFRDCRHDQEPGCAISGAAEQGEIPRERLASYREMIAT